MSSMVDDGYVFMCFRDKMPFVPARKSEQYPSPSPTEKVEESGSHASSFGKAFSSDCRATVRDRL
jgi:hypothetical protein